jgi:methyltransferase (TIGR00027 family)
MIEQTASRTALATAYLRAAHQLLDAQPRILDDPVALALLGTGGEQQIRAMDARLQSEPGRELRAHVVLRSRYAEDRLQEAVQRGVVQYVLLGAGLDTFAVRQPEWARGLRIFEIDHPATQAGKRQRLADAGLVVPPNTTFAGIDFESESLDQGLRRHGVSTDLPTFFSWLGVTMYLQRPAIDAVLRCTAGFAPGSEIVLTFLQPPDDLPQGSRERAAELARYVADVGEPFVSFYTPQEIEAGLLDAGFTSTGLLTADQAGERYFHGRPADLPVPARTALAWARR